MKMGTGIKTLDSLLIMTYLSNNDVIDVDVFVSHTITGIYTSISELTLNSGNVCERSSIIIFVMNPNKLLLVLHIHQLCDNTLILLYSSSIL